MGNVDCLQYQQLNNSQYQQTQNISQYQQRILLLTHPLSSLQEHNEW